MIPDSNLYLKSKVSPAVSRAYTEELLEKFNVKKFAWKRDDPKTSFLMFARKEEFTGEMREVTYKVTIPFIEKERRAELRNAQSELIREYDETRSMRILFHILKALLLNTDVGMAFEQAFGNYIVIGQLEDGTPVSVGDKIAQTITEKGLPALDIK